MTTQATTERHHHGRYSGYWMVTDPRSRSYLCAVDDFGNLVEVRL